MFLPENALEILFFTPNMPLTDFEPLKNVIQSTDVNNDKKRNF